MPESDDITLLKQYAEGHSEAAFNALVERYVHLVYSTALRQVCNPSHAEEITQVVFIILTRKAKSLSPRTILSGWLYQTARLTAANFQRSAIRRQRREQEAYMQSTLIESDAAVWEQIAPLLDEAMGRLGESDRNAIVLRFFENKTAHEVATTLKLNEVTARKRVSRALEKLHRYFNKRGVSSTTAIIAGTISANSVQAAPVALAKSVTAVALAQGAAASGSTLTLIQGALKIMAWTKAKTAIVSSVVVLLAAGTTTITVKEIQEHRTYPWQVEGFDGRVLDRQPPQVRILSSKARASAYGSIEGKNGQIKMMGTGVSAENVVLAAYLFYSLTRTTLSTELPQGKYDYIASLPMGNEKALQQEIKKKFGILAKRETRESDVLLLNIQNPDAPGLKQSHGNPQGGATSRNGGPGQWSCKNSRLFGLADYLEYYLGTPVIDRTGLTNRFDIDLKWKQSSWTKPNPDGLKQAVLDQLGLELVPSREPIEMLVVEKAKD